MNTVDGGAKSHVGEVHGIYRLIDVLDEKDEYRHWIYKGKCIICGHEKLAHYGKFSGENSKTTVCLHVKKYGNKIIAVREWQNKRLRSIFNSMLMRCYNENDKSYKWYGAKGVRICDEWMIEPYNFEQWALNNGYNDTLTIDRIDSNKNYCPENCQWITTSENTRKAGVVNWITIGDKTMTGKQWAAYLNLGINTINSAIRTYGTEKTTELIEKMLIDPPNTKHRKSNQTWFSTYGIQI